jgi:hypothetical protein
MSDSKSALVEEWGEAWDDYRKSGPADVKAALQWASEKAESQKEQRQLCNRFGDPEGAQYYKEKEEALQRRAAGLYALLAYMVEQGPDDVPCFEIIASRVNEDNENDDIFDLQDFIPEGTVKNARMKKEVHTEFWSRRDDGESSKKILDELAEKHSRAASTLERIVYPREAGG